MQIILMIIGLAAGAAFWWWRIKMIGDAASEATNVAGRVWGKYKRKKFLGKVNDSPLEVIDDPATAAVILLYTIVTEDGAIGPEVEATIRREIISTISPGNPTELLTFGKWTSNHATDANNIILRYGDIWRAKLNDAEKQGLVAMVKRVSEATGNGTLSTVQKSRVAKLRQRIGLPVAD
jgi:uncharacterized tellurite resistance protein B-like protein